MTRATKDPLRQSLAALEPSGATPGFTTRVLAGLATRKARRRRRQQLAFSTAAALLVVALVGFMRINGQSDESAPVAAASEAQLLREEYAQLRSDLDALRASARETAPVLYIGGDDDMDLVLDLAPIITGSAPAGLPTSTTGVDPYEL